MINTLLRYFAIVTVLIALMGVTHLGMQAMGTGANGPTPTANGEFTPRPDGHGDHDGHGSRGGHGGGGHMLSSLLIVGLVGTAVTQISQRTRRQRRTMITA
jgi:hypothetical protein